MEEEAITLMTRGSEILRKYRIRRNLKCRRGVRRNQISN